MILKTSASHWAPGIELRCDEREPGWHGRIDFYDDGVRGDNDADAPAVQTEGRLQARYAVRDGMHTSGLSAVIDALMADAARLGIAFHDPQGGRPWLRYLDCLEYASARYARDTSAPPTARQREQLREQAERIGWATYDYEPPVHCGAMSEAETAPLRPGGGHADV